MTGENVPGDGDIERVTIEDLVRGESLPQKSRDLPPLARVGYRLAIFLLLYLGAMTAVLLAEYFVNAPSAPSGTALDETTLALYRELSQISVDRTVKLFQILVLAGFLPVLTAVLGYIFGTRGDDRSES